MTTSALSTRQRLVNAAFELFTTQGVTETTTRQIADRADVNEVTLFRQFGNKHGLLLAVLQESVVLSQLETFLNTKVAPPQEVNLALKAYAKSQLQEMARIPEFLRSVVGEAGQYPPENRQALGRNLAQGNNLVAQYLEVAIQQRHLQLNLPVRTVASLLNSLLLGYTVIELTSEAHQLWDNSDDFLDSLVSLFLSGAFSSPAEISSQKDLMVNTPSIESEVLDLPAPLVHEILRKARKISGRDAAMAYTLFAAGLSCTEIATVQRTQHLCDAQEHLLQVRRGTLRQIPVNQIILGRRYGSYLRNPLTQWLKSRRDPEASLFISDVGQSLSESDVRSQWQSWVEGLVTLEGQSPTIEQAQQTWCVDLLMRGISSDDLSLLTNLDKNQLQPYAQRAREKAALAQVFQLDHPPSKRPTASS
jgi:AcrR family transcriptional regulator